VFVTTARPVRRAAKAGSKEALWSKTVICPVPSTDSTADSNLLRCAVSELEATFALVREYRPLQARPDEGPLTLNVVQAAEMLGVGR
jgi:hypothetical protein